MVRPPYPIAILGAGKIGAAIALLLQRGGDYDILVADQDPARLQAVARLGCRTAQVRDDDALQQAVSGRYAVLNALPFHRARAAAAACVRAGAHYFDLTEDVASTHAIRELAASAGTMLMPQCGLAPGFIGVVGSDLSRRFDRLLDLRMRVGALPRFPSNALRYNLTWSTEGKLHKFDTTSTTYFGLVLLMLPRFGVMTWKDVQTRIPWGTVIVFGVGISLGTALLTTQAGQWLGAQVVTHTGLDHLGPL
ncbi:saccharopine dehydrogenase NADP-binding domain-containing protein, partial [Bordetella bronchiseptica]|uniref:saccharopine dehydrogenase NADP-binding domain-containing protein n=1 Tax=Bordetella bronchiseptica TaxID=518 RepID=UPI000460CB6A